MKVKMLKKSLNINMLNLRLAWFSLIASQSFYSRAVINNDGKDTDRAKMDVIRRIDWPQNNELQQ